MQKYYFVRVRHKRSKQLLLRKPDKNEYNHRGSGVITEIINKNFAILYFFLCTLCGLNLGIRIYIVPLLVFNNSMTLEHKASALNFNLLFTLFYLISSIFLKK